ncbi:MAG: peptide-methionine (S)-S-oxide reductase [Luteolibacter sp.]
MEKKLGKKIGTQGTAFEKFYSAEGCHQDYVKLNPKNKYIRKVSIPNLIEAVFKE